MSLKISDKKEVDFGTFVVKEVSRKPVSQFQRDKLELIGEIVEMDNQQVVMSASKSGGFWLPAEGGELNARSSVAKLLMKIGLTEVSDDFKELVGKTLPLSRDDNGFFRVDV